MLSALFPLGNIETLQSPGNRGFEGRKSSVGSTVFYIRPPKSNFGIWHPNLKFEFYIKVNKTNVPWEPKMLIGRLRMSRIKLLVFSMSIKRGMEVRFSKAGTRGFSRRFAVFRRPRREKPLAPRVEKSEHIFLFMFLRKGYHVTNFARKTKVSNYKCWR